MVDCNNGPVVPDEYYLIVTQHGDTLSREYISGEDLIAAADFFDQLMSQKDDNNDNTG